MRAHGLREAEAFERACDAERGRWSARTAVTVGPVECLLEVAGGRDRKSVNEGSVKKGSASERPVSVYRDLHTQILALLGLSVMESQ